VAAHPGGPAWAMTHVTVRLFIAGKLCDEDDLPIGAGRFDLLEESALRHREMVTAAMSEGLTWMVEIVFPDGDHVRWGTDENGMVQPIPVDDLEAALSRRYES
jgi:hypothetical protein